MANDTIKYTSSISGTTVLDVNDGTAYLMLSFEPKSGKQKSSWRPGLQTDGDMPGERRHFGNGSLDCTCLVRGTSDSDLDLKVNALVDQFKKRVSYIEYKAINRAESRWYIAYWMEEGPETSYYDVLRRQSGTEAEVKWTQQIFPYKLGAEETISVSGVASASVVNLTGIKGDGPALMDVYIDPTGSYLPSFLMLGERESYDSDFQAVFETATGTTVNHSECLNGSYQTHPSSSVNHNANLIVNGDLEDVDVGNGLPSSLPLMRTSGAYAIRNTGQYLTATVSRAPTYASLMGVVTPVVKPGGIEYLSAVDGDFETGIGNWVGAYGVSDLSSSMDWSYAGTHSLKIVASGDIVVALDITNVTNAESAYVLSLQFVGVAGRVYWLQVYDDVGGHQGQLMPIVGTGALQTLSFTCVFGVCTYRQISFRSAVTSAGDVVYIDRVVVVDGPPTIAFPTASLGITPGMPISIVLVVNHTNAWNDGQPHVMFFTNNLYPNGPPWEGFEVNATIFGTIAFGLWHGTGIKVKAIALDAVNWAPNVDHIIVATMDTAANMRIFVDGVEGLGEFGGCTRETAVGAYSYMGSHPDYIFPINGPELCAIYGYVLNDSEIAAISAMTDFTTLGTVGSGGISDWANITETRSWNGPGTFLMQTDTGSRHSGSRSVMYDLPVASLPGSYFALYALDFDAVPVTVGHTYQFSFWDMLLRNFGMHGWDIAHFRFHNVSHGITGDLVYERTLALHNDWQQWVVNLPAIPADTTHVHIETTLCQANELGWTVFKLYQDDFILRDLSPGGLSGAVFSKTFPMKHKGYYEIAAQVGTDTTGIDSDALALHATPHHSTLGALGGEPDYSEVAAIGDGGTLWRNTAMLASSYPLLPIPTGNVSENAVLTSLSERLDMSVASSYNAGDFRSDFTALIPVDQAVARITNNLASHIIIDSRSDVPAILQSIDGTLESATMMNPAQTSADLKFVANPDGVNLALLMLYNNGGSYEPRCVANLKFVYRPYYYLTP